MNPETIVAIGGAVGTAVATGFGGIKAVLMIAQKFNGRNGHTNGNGKHPSLAQFAALETKLEERTKSLDSNLALIRADMAGVREDTAKGLAEVHRRINRIVDHRGVGAEE